MLALRQVAGAGDEALLPSSSATRTSSPVTEASPPPSEGPGSRREGKVHRPGDVVDGRYVLISPLGKGGMGVVWKARSTALDVEVAVKLVRGSTPSAEAFKRMAREAHAAARLGHPAMATVLDFGATPDGDPYVVMELLHGESLGEVLGREQRVDTLRAVSMLLPIMDGLREAHDKGIVHRDLKPENLFLSKTARGRLQPKVLDFGIAKLEQQTDSSTRLTQDGAVLGSPGYFSPEQARGEIDIDARTDIWSISVVLYELITGDLPFTGPNYNALLMSILKDNPKPITTYGFGDEELWHIVQRGLHREREQRWPTMWELGRALAQWLFDKGVRADAASRSLEEVWLEARPSEAPAPESPTKEGGTPRRVLSTLIKRRAADTLAGETISTLNSQRRVATRLLGWGAAAAGVFAVGWSVLAQSPNAPGAHAAAARETGAALAPPPPPAPLASNTTPAPTVAPGEPIATAMVRAAEPRAPKRTSASNAEVRARLLETSSSSSGESQKLGLVQRRATEAAKTRRPAPTVTKAAVAKPTVKKRIDQEFGF
jgi:eukaryotic-like serine/threonine-protein kinase